MTGMVVGVMRGILPREMFLAALMIPNLRVKDVPTAPGYCLLLDRVSCDYVPNCRLKIVLPPPLWTRLG